MGGSTPAARLVDIRGLSLFGDAAAAPYAAAVRDLLGVLAGADASPEDLARAWAAAAGAAAAEGPFDVAVAEAAAASLNPFTLVAERLPRGLPPTASLAGFLPPPLAAACACDLARLGRLARTSLADLGREAARRLEAAGFPEAADDVRAEAEALDDRRSGDARPAGSLHPAAAALLASADWRGAVDSFARGVASRGAGVLGAAAAFAWEAGSLRPVRDADPVRIADLFDYEDQRAAVLANTRRFAEGARASNILLYGDRGTGKSATVKAACNELAGTGLKLVELRKSDIGRLGAVMEALGSRGARFVVFLDDLAFRAADDSYVDAKALLEGGVERRPDNVVVYATSNRRHLVKESSPQAPSPRASDSVQEELSLADRFGVTIVFCAPDQEGYLRIAEGIARSRGLLPEGAAEREGFRSGALLWERWFNGRSPRTARQYVDWIEGGSPFPWEGGA